MRSRILALALAASAAAAEARAADTTETFGIGASEFELYLGLDGAGLGDYEKTVWAETLVGFGITERFSAYVTGFAEGNERFSAGAGGGGFGVFGTPVDTDHLDLDLFLGAGFGDGSMSVAPALELNLDARPDLALCGLYLRAEEALAGRDDSIADDPATPEIDEARERHAFAPTTALTFGGYLTIAEIHQILLEWDMAFHHGEPPPGEEARALEAGAVALGWNVAVADNVELLAQISADVPTGDEPVSGGFMLGMIATMP